MSAIAETASGSKAARWTGYMLSGLVSLFLLFDAGIKLVPLDIVTETSAQLGLPTDATFARTLAILTLIGVALYVVPGHRCWVRSCSPATWVGRWRLICASAARCSPTCCSDSIWAS